MHNTWEVLYKCFAGNINNMTRNNTNTFPPHRTFLSRYTLNRHKNSPFLSTIFLFAMFWIFYWYHFLRGCLEQSCSLLSPGSRVSNLKKNHFFKSATSRNHEGFMNLSQFSRLFRTVRYRGRVCQWSQAWEPNPPVSSKRCAAVPACTERGPPAASPTV